MCLLSWAAPLHQATSQVVLLRYCHFSSVKSQLQRSQGFPFAPFIPNLCEEFRSVWDFWLGAIDSLVRGFLLQFPSHPLSFSPSLVFPALFYPFHSPVCYLRSHNSLGRWLLLAIPFIGTINSLLGLALSFCCLLFSFSMRLFLGERIKLIIRGTTDNTRLKWI